MAEANTESLPTVDATTAPAQVPATQAEPQAEFSGDAPKYIKGSPAVRILMVIFGLILIAMAVVTGRELWWVRQEGNQGQAWIRPALDWIANLGEQSWFFPVGIAVGVVGVVLLILALKPAPPKYIAVASGQTTNVYMRPIDIARRSTAVAERVAGVYDATTTVNRKATRITVNVEGNDAPDLAERVERSIHDHLGQLASNPTVQVNVRKEEA